MEKERLQEYAARVTQANRSELVVIIYEATLASIEEGKNYLKQGEIEAARHEIERARSMITELMGIIFASYMCLRTGNFVRASQTETRSS